MITSRDARVAEIIALRQRQRADQVARRTYRTPAVPVPIRADAPAGPTITVITPTGDRPLAFRLCQEWMRRQTRRPDQWLVIDDGKTPLVPETPMQYVRREARPDDPRFTLDLNMKTALPLITGDKILIMEDDEYYAPEYIEEISRRLDQHEIVGIVHAKYYYLPTGGYYTNTNVAHASLAETAFRVSFLPTFAECVNRGSTPDFLDTQLWRRASKDGLFLDSERSLYVGMKGLPGRAGMGTGHNPSIGYRNQRDDPDHAMLKQWMPKDYQIYLDILNGKLTSENYKSYFPNIPQVTCITPTGDRPLAFALCQLWMARQTRKPDQWIVVDDGHVPTKPITQMVEYVRRDPMPGEPRVTLSLNLLKAIDLIRGDLVFIIEDDDYYAPSYIASLAAALEKHEIVGIGCGRYYHVSTGQYKRHPNTAHASLGSTAFRKSIVPDLRIASEAQNVQKNNGPIDCVLWPRVAERGFVFSDEDARPLYVGMKAMPGRAGASHGHNPKDRISGYYCRDDSSHSLLKTWTGEAADIYIGLAQRTLNERDVVARVEAEVNR